MIFNPGGGGSASEMVGATSSEDGKSGTVPAPKAGQDRSFYLSAESVWRRMAGASMEGVRQKTGTNVFTSGKTGAEIFNDTRTRIYDTASSDPKAGNIAIGEYAHAEGTMTSANGKFAHAEGYMTKALGNSSHSEGNNSKASGTGSHAGGTYANSIGKYSFAHGDNVSAQCFAGVALGVYNNIGEYNPDSVGVDDPVFQIGNGTGAARSNAFRVTYSGQVYGKSTFNSSGADYAEMFEWSDSNQNDDDRVGRFVTLLGDKISLASHEDTDILGVVSGAPTVLGDVYDDQWQGMYLTDIYGRNIYEYVDVPAEIGPDGEEISPARRDYVMKVNPDYDSSIKYIQRTKRKEWDAVGLLGKLVMLDDGTAEVNGYVKSADDGIATKSEERTKFRVMARLDENHIRILIL